MGGFPGMSVDGIDALAEHRCKDGATRNRLCQTVGRRVGQQQTPVGIAQTLGIETGPEFPVAVAEQTCHGVRLKSALQNLLIVVERQAENAMVFCPRPERFSIGSNGQTDDVLQLETVVGGGKMVETDVSSVG